ncbi:MAG: hydroxysqualene dehydroxylase HpnE, partial [Dehalococcoidia bacterium]
MADNDDKRGALRPQVMVIGAGLAGLSATCELADAGCKVTLVERKPYVGGRTYSFRNGPREEEIDNGQHVFLKCCTYYIDFLKKLGVYQKTHLQPSLRAEFIDINRGPSSITSSPLPAPFHMLPSLLLFKHLSLLDKALVLYAATRILLIGEEGRKSLDHLSFYQWLRSNHQRDKAIRNFWNLLILPTLNDDVHSVSANAALMVFQEGLFKTRDGGNIGYSRVGLSSLLAQEASDYIKSRGGEIILGKGVASLEIGGGKVTGVRLPDGQVLKADYYVSAVPHHRLPSLLPPSLRDEPSFSRASKLKSTPIVNLHIWFDRVVTDVEFAAFLNSDIQWLFNKSKIYGLNSFQGQYLCISLSGARKYIDMPKEELKQRFIAELNRILPVTREAKVEQFTVVRER